MILFIINYNRLEYTRNMANWAISNGLIPVILDNGSDYEPLLKYYEITPIKVIRFNSNHGHKVLWKFPVLFEVMGVNGEYLVTDPDLDLSKVPSDFLTVMRKGLKKYPQFHKCGLSLEISDLPDTVIGKQAKEWEQQWWTKPLDDLYFDAGVDTTFALYNSRIFTIDNSLRINRPYTAKHLPWYYTNLDRIPADERNYLFTANSSSYWNQRIMNQTDIIISTYLVTAIDEQRGISKKVDDLKYINTWVDSILTCGCSGVILHDGLSAEYIKQFPFIKFVSVPPVPKGTRLYDYRWFIIQDYLQKNPKIKNVFHTDISDCTVINNPFLQPEYKKGILYCGDEPSSIAENTWMQRMFRNPSLKKLPELTSLFTSYNRILNPGILGGDRDTVLSFLKAFTNKLTELKDRTYSGMADMDVFNYVMFCGFTPQFGPPVNTIFRAYEDRKDVWFKHK